MAFVDRIVEYPNRYNLIDGNGDTFGTYTLERAEGEITEAGTLLNAANLNSGIVDVVAESDFIVAETVEIIDGLTVNAGNYATTSKSVAKTGYTPIGIVGVHLENATSGGTYNTYCFTHSFYLSGSTAYFTLRNIHASTNAKVKLSVTVLYVKN